MQRASYHTYLPGPYLTVPTCSCRPARRPSLRPPPTAKSAQRRAHLIAAFAPPLLPLPSRIQPRPVKEQSPTASSLGASLRHLIRSPAFFSIRFSLSLSTFHFPLSTFPRPLTTYHFSRFPVGASPAHCSCCTPKRSVCIPNSTRGCDSLIRPSTSPSHLGPPAPPPLFRICPSPQRPGNVGQGSCFTGLARGVIAQSGER